MIDKQNRMLAVMRSEHEATRSEFERLETMFRILLKKLPMTTYHDYLKEMELLGRSSEPWVGYHVAEFEDKWSSTQFREQLHKDMMDAIVSPTRIKLKDINST